MSPPNISVKLEPKKSLTMTSYLRCAASSVGGNETGLVNLGALITNLSSNRIVLTRFEVGVANSITPPKQMLFALRLDPGASGWWVQNEDYTFRIPPGPLSLTLKIYGGTNPDPFVVQSSLIAHTNPTPEQSYRFWGRVRDLRPGEFWQVHGSSHGQTLPQMFGYDIGIGADSGDGYTQLLPDTDGTANDHFRIWGKPVYAVADGTVVDFLNDYPTNPNPFDPNAMTYAQAFPDLKKLQDDTGHGNGNFFTIKTGDETVLYAHMQPGSLNPGLLAPNAVVKTGDFLGLAGNSGNSNQPHLHVHSNRNKMPTENSWETVARPIVMRGARALAWPAVTSNPQSAHWVALDKKGIPTTDCAVWPSEQSVVKLRYAEVRHMAISEAGQLWIVRTDHGIRTTNDLFPTDFGVYLDVLPGGGAKEIALVKEQPFIIGMNDRLFAGQPTGWVQVAGSPALKRISVNRTSGIIWAIKTDNGIVALNPVTGQWFSDPVGGKGKDIVSRGGTAYVIGTDDYIYQGGGPSGWGRIAGEGRAKRIALDPVSGPLWVIGMNDGIWSYDGAGGWNEHPEEGRGKDVLSFQGTPYIIGTDDNVWRSAGAFGWSHLNVVEGT